MEAIKNRYEFVFLFDVKDGNPNGDPDFDNMPRTDEETDQGLVSDVCIKRKVRNYIHLLKGLKTPYDIFIREGNILNPLIQEKRDEADKTNDEEKKAVKSGRQAMCAQYFDIRTFGAVMSTGEEKAEEEETEEKGKKKKANSKKKIKGLGVVREQTRAYLRRTQCFPTLQQNSRHIPVTSRIFLSAIRIEMWSRCIRSWTRCTIESIVSGMMSRAKTGAISERSCARVFRTARQGCSLCRNAPEQITTTPSSTAMVRPLSSQRLR